LFAFVIALAAILWGVYLIAIGKDASGLTAIIAALVGLVGVFVYGKYIQVKERERKLRPIEERDAHERQLNLFEDSDRTATQD
jgi:membrane associated rhomboid family serine protease